MLATSLVARRRSTGTEQEIGAARQSWRGSSHGVSGETLELERLDTRVLAHGGRDQGQPVSAHPLVLLRELPDRFPGQEVGGGDGEVGVEEDPEFRS